MCVYSVSRPVVGARVSLRCSGRSFNRSIIHQVCVCVCAPACNFCSGCLAQVEGEQEQLPVSFRYNVRPAASMRTNVFKANPLQQNADVKFNNLGAIFVGKWQDLPDSKVLDVLWEAGGSLEGVLGATDTLRLDCLPEVPIKMLNLSNACLPQVQMQGNKIVPTKPKMHLTAVVTVPPNSWVQLP